MSFRDPKLNKNLGVAIIKGVDNLDDAMQKSWDLEINPGGEIGGVVISEATFKEEGLKANRLYSREEMKELGYKTGI
jgi:hypothetical protein